MKHLLLTLVLCVALVGCGKRASDVNIFAGQATDIAFERDALQQLSKALKDNPSANSFTVRWTLQLNGKTSNPEITYDRQSKVLKDGNATEYSNVVDDAIHQAADKHQPVASIAEFGAKQDSM